MTKDIVKSVVDKADPIGLLGMCCPADEYDSEIEIIFARIQKGMSADEIAKVIHAVFLEMFSESIDTKLCDTMACEMLSLDSDHTFDHLRLRTTRILCREEHTKAVNPDAKAPKSP